MSECKIAERSVTYCGDIVGLRLTVGYGFEHDPGRSLLQLHGKHVSAGVHCDTKDLARALRLLSDELEEYLDGDRRLEEARETMDV